MDEIVRCRPLLGTFVQIRARGHGQATLHRAVGHAFENIERVHALMSFHSDTSDLSLVNREAVHHAVTVDEWTFEVLEAAMHLSKVTRGVFDITVGNLLRKWGYLPGEQTEDSDIGSYKNIILGSNNTVRFLAPLTIDLGGIAKGFAVDKAVEVLMAEGVDSGIVNAGGDIRAFGDHEESIRLRTPDFSDTPLPFLTLRNEAVATSSPVPSMREVDKTRVSPMIDGITKQPFLAPVSISIQCATCMIADGLTKVVAAMGELAVPALSLFRARAYKFEQGCLFELEPTQ